MLKMFCVQRSLKLTMDFFSLSFVRSLFSIEIHTTANSSFRLLFKKENASRFSLACFSIFVGIEIATQVRSNAFLFE